MRRYKVKKLFRNHASVRDYIIDSCLLNKEGIIIEFNYQQMTIPYEQLKNTFQFHKKQFRSKFDNRVYELYDFYFKPDKREG
jgi:hypothetical protein